MSQPLRVLHGEFGRLMLVQLNETMADHAVRAGKLLFKVGGCGLRARVGERVHLIGSNDVVMVNAWECHAYECVDPSASSLVLSIEVEPQWAKGQGRRLAGLVSRNFYTESSGSASPEVLGAVAELTDLLAYELTLCSAKIEALIAQIVLGLAEVYADPTDVGGMALMAGAACDARIRMVLSLMAATVGEPMLMAHLARAAQISRPHFFHLFKQETRLTPLIYSSMLRMEKAVQQISETPASMEAISLNLGFESPGNFTRFFKVHQGFSPSQYRRKVTVLPRVRPEDRLRPRLPAQGLALEVRDLSLAVC